MDAKDLERREWLGVLGAGAVAAAITALAMPWPAQGQSPIVVNFSHVVAVDTPKGAASGVTPSSRPARGF